MRQNFSWDKSAIEYVKLYRDVLGLPPEASEVPETKAEPKLIS
jgi:starch synthase